MGLVRQCSKWLFDSLYADNEALYRFCRKYVDRYNSDNNDRMQSNGELEFMRQALQGAHVVFDVGANVGNWVRAALSINPEAEYHCFEPSAATYRALVNEALPSNVKTNNCGLGAKDGEAPLFVFDDGSGTNSLYRREGIGTTQPRRDNIRLITIDRYCDQHDIAHVDFVKLDVEGHELAVLHGARRMLSEGRINVVQFEYGGTYIDARILLKDIWDYVDEVNQSYSFFKLYPEGLCAIPAYRQTMETFKYSNWAIRLG